MKCCVALAVLGGGRNSGARRFRLRWCVVCSCGVCGVCGLCERNLRCACLELMAPQRVCILGGGISGLTLAWRLRRARPSTVHVTILEASERLGGWIRTERDDGFIFERGPRGFRPSGNGTHMLQLVEELGLAGAAVKSDAAAAKRFIWCDGRMQQMPSSLGDLLSLPPVLREALRGIAAEPWQPPGLWADESVHDFASRRLGSVVAEKILGAVVSGIYGGDPRQLSMRSCFPRVWDMEKESGSIFRNVAHSIAGKGKQKKAEINVSAFVESFSKASQVSFVGGMEQIVETLQNRLQEDDLVDIVTCSDVVGITCNSDGGGGQSESVAVVSSSGTSDMNFDHLFSTISAPNLSNLLGHVSQASGESLHERNALSSLRTNLDEISATDIGVVNFALRGSEYPLNGFGYLIPRCEGDPLLGVSFDSCIFPTQETGAPAMSGDTHQAKGRSRVCAMISADHIMNQTEEGLKDLAVEGLRKHLGVTPDERNILAYRAGVMSSCIPQYRVNHSAVVRDIELQMNQLYPGVTILGTSFYGVGLADAVAVATEKAMQYVGKVTHSD